MKKNWNILSNRFDASTKRNYKMMHRMINHHADYIGASSDPFIHSLFKETDEMRTAFCSAWATWTARKGGRKGETQRVKQLLKKLYTEKIPKWEVDILVRFNEKSPEYKALFKGGRTGFRRGPYVLRAQRLASLAKSLADFPGLFVTKMDVEDFYSQLTSVLNINKGETVGVKISSEKMEAARKAAAIKMYANLGHLMAHFADNPGQVKRFFETSKLRRRKPKSKIKADIKRQQANKTVTPKASAPIVPGGYDVVRLFQMAN